MALEVGLPDIKSKSIQAPTRSVGAYRPLLTGQTVCTVKDDKGQNCTGHVKQWFTAGPEVTEKAEPGNTIHRCQRCFTIYEGPPQEYLQPRDRQRQE
jgi:hypothetical protein